MNHLHRTGRRFLEIHSVRESVFKKGLFQLIIHFRAIKGLEARSLIQQTIGEFEYQFYFC